MATINIKITQWNNELVKSGKVLVRILGIFLTAYLAFFSYLAVHEWAGHILADALVFTWHGTHFEVFDVIIQWLNIKMQTGHWAVTLAPFRIGAEVVSAIPHDLFTFTDWEVGFSTLMGSGITALISLVTLAVLNLRKDLPRFPWFAGFFILYSIVFDQIQLTFGNPTDALDGAVMMGADPLMFKIIVISLALLQSWLLVRFGIRYRRGRQARPVVSK